MLVKGVKHMEERKISAPAILIFKGLSELTGDFSIEEKATLFDAICNYADGKVLPELSSLVSIVFKVIKRDIDKNEEKYAKKCERNKRYNEKKRKEHEKVQSSEKGEESPEDKPKQRSKPILAPSELTKEQQAFLKSFEELFPNKKIDCNISEFQNIDFNALITGIKRSPQFLMNGTKNKAFGLRWYLENADKIISGYYEKFKEENKANFKQRDYEDVDVNALYQTVDEIEI